MKSEELDMTDTVVRFYECGRLVSEILIKDIFAKGYKSFEEYWEHQKTLGAESYLVGDKDERLES